MSGRASLGFEDETLVEKAEVLDLSAFQPTAAKKPDKAQVALAAEQNQFKSREVKPVVAVAALEAPIRNARGRRRTGRTAQINLKATNEAIAQFYQIADDNGLIYGEAFERAVDLLGKSFSKK